MEEAKDKKIHIPY